MRLETLQLSWMYSKRKFEGTGGKVSLPYASLENIRIRKPKISWGYFDDKSG